VKKYDFKRRGKKIPAAGEGKNLKKHIVHTFGVFKILKFEKGSLSFGFPVI
jgi:hypothetical protein